MTYSSVETTKTQQHALKIRKQAATAGRRNLGNVQYLRKILTVGQHIQQPQQTVRQSDGQNQSSPSWSECEEKTADRKRWGEFGEKGVTKKRCLVVIFWNTWKLPLKMVSKQWAISFWQVSAIVFCETREPEPLEKVILQWGEGHSTGIKTTFYLILFYFDYLTRLLISESMVSRTKMSLCLGAQSFCKTKNQSLSTKTPALQTKTKSKKHNYISVWKDFIEHNSVSSSVLMSVCFTLMLCRYNFWPVHIFLRFRHICMLTFAN